jgi:RNase adaptor protein for sRNA GlmZ degradation
MGVVVILRGVSGSGKSTVAKLYEELGFYIASADKYFWTIDHRYVFDATKLQEAHDYCFAMFKMHLLEEHGNVVVDNTNTTEREIKRYVDYANERGHRLISLVVEKRHDNYSIHDVPDAVVKKQAARLAQSIKLI